MSEERATISGQQYLAGLFLFLYKAVRGSLFLMIATTLVVTLIAYFATPRPALVYGAKGIIQIGRVAGMDAMDPEAAAARVMGPSFKRRLLQSMNLSAAENNRATRLFSDGLTVKPESSGNLTVNIGGASDEQARQALDVVVRLLNEDQEEFRGPVLANINAQIAESDANIASLLKTRESLLALTKAPPTGDKPEAQAADLQSVWVSDLLSRNENSLMTARADRRERASRLGSWNTYPTAIVDDVVVSSSPASPRPSRIAFLAGGFTFVGFLLYALVRGRRAARSN
jgi:hypothetical protein